MFIVKNGGLHDKDGSYEEIGEDRAHSREVEHKREAKGVGGTRNQLFWL